MWLDQGTTWHANEVLIKKLSICLTLLEEFQKKVQNSTHMSAANEFKKLISSLLVDLEENEAYDENDFKLLIKFSKDNAKQFGGHFRHKSFACLCKNINKTLNELNLEDEQFIPPPETLDTKKIDWHSVNRICFRGDSQTPDIIFAKGFIPRDSDSPAVNSSIELSKLMIPFTSRFYAATLSPLDAEVETTWVYIFYAKKGVNAHKHGYTALANNYQPNKGALGLFVEELITDHIESQNIIGAVRIIRYGHDKVIDTLPSFIKKNLTSETAQILADFIKKRGKYVISEYLKNPDCTLSSETKKLADWYIKKEKMANRSNQSAQESDNLNSSVPKKAVEVANTIEKNDSSKVKI